MYTRLVAAAVIFTTVSGCRGEPAFTFAPVEGTVTKGGRPLPNVLVTFFPDPAAGTLGPRSTGLTDRAGRYVLTAGPDQTGAVVGSHRVCLFDADLLGPSGDSAGPVEPSRGGHVPRVPPAHGELRDSPHRAEVRADGVVVDFDLSG